MAVNTRLLPCRAPPLAIKPLPRNAFAPLQHLPPRSVSPPNHQHLLFYPCGSTIYATILLGWPSLKVVIDHLLHHLLPIPGAQHTPPGLRAAGSAEAVHLTQGHLIHFVTQSSKLPRPSLILALSLAGVWFLARDLPRPTLGSSTVSGSTLVGSSHLWRVSCSAF